MPSTPKQAARDAATELRAYGMHTEAERAVRRAREVPRAEALPDNVRALYVGRRAMLLGERGRTAAPVKCHAVRRAPVGNGVHVLVRMLDGSGVLWADAGRVYVGNDLRGALLEIAEAFELAPRPALGLDWTEAHAPKPTPRPVRANVAQVSTSRAQVAA